MTHEVTTTDPVGMDLMQQAKVVSGTGIVPDYLRGKPDWIFAMALKGRGLGFDLMTSLDALYYVKGKVTISAQGMVAIAKRRVEGADVAIIESDDKVCTVEARRPNCAPVRVSKNFKVMSERGLTTQGTWKKYPENMLRWRAITDACRIQFADVLTGFYTPDEMGADVNEEGEPVIVEADAVVVTEPVADTTDYQTEVSQIMGKLQDGIGEDIANTIYTKLVDKFTYDTEINWHPIYLRLTNGLRNVLRPSWKEQWGEICTEWIKHETDETTQHEWDEFIKNMEGRK